jgi:hypothetical protein
LKTRILVGLVVFACCADVQGATWVRAEVYFIPWLTEFIAALSPQAVRDFASHGDAGHIFHIRSAERIEELVKVLELARLRPEKRCSGDSRLVVDLFSPDGHRMSLRSDGASLCTIDNLSSHPVGDRFRNYFDRLKP